jgi:hypothetical protein
MGVTTYVHETKGNGGESQLRAELTLDPDNLGVVQTGDDG